MSTEQYGCMKVRELIKILERDGWYQSRHRGSHRQFRHAEKPGTVTVSGQLGADVPKGDARCHT
ncbi:MAG TPA: type II toxin-antitoxin system HicA family toxin [Gammaproteobacteria bacterium]|nr:type II toxin-antitoxin system HicA family toxin [Gammaproteobacteria bacterium]